MRKRPWKGIKEELPTLCCPNCHKQYTASSRLNATLEQGYIRLGLAMPTEADVLAMRWKMLKKEPPNEKSAEYEKYLLDLACVQLDVQLHHWRHRNSCFKKGEKDCRYKIPSNSSPSTSVKPISTTDGSSSSEKISKLEVDVKKRPPFIFLTD